MHINRNELIISTGKYLYWLLIFLYVLTSEKIFWSNENAEVWYVSHCKRDAKSLRHLNAPSDKKVNKCFYNARIIEY